MKTGVFSLCLLISLFLFSFVASCGGGGGGSSSGSGGEADSKKLYYGGTVHENGKLDVALATGDVSEAITFEGHVDGAGNIESIDGIIYANKEANGTLTVYYGADLRPSSMVDSVSGVTYEFGEYADGVVNVTVKDAGGTVIEENRQVEIDADAFNYFADLKASARSGPASNALTADEKYQIDVAASGAALGLGAAGCAGSVVLAKKPGVIAWACGSAAVTAVSAACTVAQAQNGLCDAMTPTGNTAVFIDCAKSAGGMECVANAALAIVPEITKEDDQNGNGSDSGTDETTPTDPAPVDSCYSLEIEYSETLESYHEDCFWTWDTKADGSMSFSGTVPLSFLMGDSDSYSFWLDGDITGPGTYDYQGEAANPRNDISCGSWTMTTDPPPGQITMSVYADVVGTRVSFESEEREYGISTRVSPDPHGEYRMVCTCDDGTGSGFDTFTSPFDSGLSNIMMTNASEGGGLLAEYDTGLKVVPLVVESSDGTTEYYGTKTYRWYVGLRKTCDN
ncbi:MAG: hypothetical protein ACNS63_02975 [Candidatus Nitrospinota bacterium M3_3B_026]